ncbi:MAG: transcriptional repressor LexA [Desulfuromonadales bacterium]|nr:transcriptional repressor LexA [Desulfuromonadales bacterium]
MRPLTDRQQQVLDCINHHIDRHGYPPTLREIAAALNINGTLGVLKHLRALEKSGAISKQEGASRALRVTARTESGKLPIIGTIQAGALQPAIEEIQGEIEIGQKEARGGTFFLRVRGDSMIDAAILDGDLALIKPQPDADNGDIVVALVGDEATLKRFYREKGRIRLQPENQQMQPIFVGPDESEIRIIGKMVSLLRQY